MMRAFVFILLLLPAAAAAQTNFPIDLNHEIQRRLQDRTDQIESGAIPRDGGIARPESAMPIEAERGDVVSIAGQRYRLWGIAAPRPNEYGGFIAPPPFPQLIAGHPGTSINPGPKAESCAVGPCPGEREKWAGWLGRGGVPPDMRAPSPG
ncbi:MAG: hypothetical protein IBJ15_21575, partial [Alphaproteobacteria bacterium]|nr:hypothetical protein [Alphaproteobacteria bacterium]